LYLGADTPVTDLAHACLRNRPDLVVVAATRATALLGAARELRRVAERYPIAIGRLIVSGVAQLSADSGPPGLQRASTICESVTTGRQGSMFHEGLFGSTSRA
jgi:hypothetical protein